MDETIELLGARILPQCLDRAAQEAQAADLRQVVVRAPLQRYVTRSGKAMSVQMTACGPFGWISDRGGYRYAEGPAEGARWPPIPGSLLALWRRVLPQVRDPECCLVNLYDPGARMGLHQDRDEADLTQPVLSVSLGDDGLFRIGGTARSDPTRSIWLRSGDVVVLEGPSRLAYHGIDRIRPGTSDLLRQPGRLNLTMRVVT